MPQKCEWWLTMAAASAAVAIVVGLGPGDDDPVAATPGTAEAACGEEPADVFTLNNDPDDTAFRWWADEKFPSCRDVGETPSAHRATCILCGATRELHNNESYIVRCGVVRDKDGNQGPAEICDTCCRAISGATIRWSRTNPALHPGSDWYRIELEYGYPDVFVHPVPPGFGASP